MSATKLTKRQQFFVDEYLIDLNGTRAYMAAYPNLKSKDVAGVNASKLLRTAKIDAAIQAAMQARAERTQISADRVLEEYAKIAFLDVRDMYHPDGRLKEIYEMDEKVSACIAGMDVLSRDGEKETTKKIKIADKLKALQDIGRHIGLFEKDKLKIPPVPPSLYIVLDEADEATDDNV